jgi:hypothetical protein
MRGGTQSCGARGSTGALLHGGGGPEPWNTRLHQSPPELGGEVRNCGTRGSAGALPRWEAGPRAAEHTAAPEPTPCQEAGPEAAEHVAVRTHALPCLDLEPVREGTRSAGYRHNLSVQI